MKVLIVGTGSIAPYYVQTLKALGVEDISVLGRDAAKAAELASRHDLANGLGGGESTLTKVAKSFDAIILASAIPTLLPLLRICEAVAPQARVLVEKPVALSSGAVEEFLLDFPDTTANVALNRRYFPSVELLGRILQTELPRSAQFSFTEWTHRIDPTAYSADVLSRWGLSNCIHVIDTVIALIGLPSRLDVTIAGDGELAWHPSGTMFFGSGRSHADVQFSYASDFCSAGRWSIRVYTDRGRYDLEPMESLRFTEAEGGVEQTLLAHDAGGLKCGFEPMVSAWLGLGKVRPTLGLRETIPTMQAIEQIFGY
jgi:predicted dehydrogenase